MYNIAALKDETFDDSMEFGAFVAHGFAGLWILVFACAELAEVFAGAWMAAAEEMEF